MSEDQNFEDEQDEGVYDPFDGDGTQVATLIVLMRIYDVLMADLTKNNLDAARKLSELHGDGKIIGSPPYMDGFYGLDETD